MASKQNNKRRILLRYALVVGFMLVFSAFIIWNMFKFTSCPIVLFMAKSSLPPIRSLFTLEESLSRFP